MAALYWRTVYELVRTKVAMCLLLALGSAASAAAAEPTADAFELCRSIGRGINLGNGLEAPREGAYWEFGSGFGAYDPGNSQWRKPLLEALVTK